MDNTNLTDARAELLRLERMAAHQRSVVAALEALDGPPSLTPACTLEPLGTGPLTDDVFSTASPERILADIQTFWDWCARDGNQPPLPNPGLLA